MLCWHPYYFALRSAALSSSGSRLFQHLLHARHNLGGPDVEGRRKAHDRADGRTAQPSLDHADKRAVKSSFERQVLLGDPFLFPKLTKRLPEGLIGAEQRVNLLPGGTRQALMLLERVELSHGQ